MAKKPPRRRRSASAPAPVRVVAPGHKPPHPMPDVTSDVDRYDEAIHAFQRRLPVSRGEWDKLAERERKFAFTVSAVSQAELLLDVYDAIESAVRDGTDLETFKANVQESLFKEWGAEDASRVETIFRTNVQTAYNEGRYEVYSAPAVKEARPYFRFDAIDDDRADDECLDLNGTILEQDDPFWDENHPPLHFNALVAGTLITTARGPIAIERIGAGEKVLTHRGRWRPVDAVMSKLSDTMTVLRVQLSTGRELLVTKEHPVLGLGGWKPAGHLKLGDQLFEHGDPVRRTGQVSVAHPENFPSLFDEPSVAYQVRRLARPVLVRLAVQLERHLRRREREVNYVPADRELRRRLLTEQAVYEGLRRKKVAPIRIRDRLRARLGNAGGVRRVSRRHTDRVLSVNLARLLAQAPRPMLRAAASAYGLVADRYLRSLGANRDLVAPAPARQYGLAKARVALDRADRLTVAPVTLHDQFRDHVPVAEVQWFHSSIISIAEIPSTTLLWNLAVREDQSYVAAGQVVHNCRCVITGLSREEADDEGVDDEAPDTDHADDGFGGRPERGGENWEPDLGKYPDEIRDELEAKLKV